MPSESQNPDDPCGDPAAGDWGWALVQRDWGLRQDEPPGPVRLVARVVAKGAVKIEELAVRAWRVVLRSGHGAAR